MVAFSAISARPRYRSRASAGSVPFVNATLQLASLGTTSVSANVSLQRSLAGRIPNIAFSNLAAPPSTQRARLDSRLNIGNANPQSFGNPANLEAFGKDIGKRVTDARIENIVSTFGTDTSRVSPGALSGTGGGFSLSGTQGGIPRLSPGALGGIGAGNPFSAGVAPPVNFLPQTAPSPGL